MAGGLIAMLTVGAVAATKKPAPAPVATAEPVEPPPAVLPAVITPMTTTTTAPPPPPAEVAPPPHKRAKVEPFGHGSVGAHANVLRIKMDGAIDSILGAQQPTGFTVSVPGRKSVDAASPLAARDSRLAAIRVANETGGAELSVTFKDGVPPYQVRARGDTLEIALARYARAGEAGPAAHASHAAHKKKKH